MASHNDLGNQGEKIAAHFIIKKGYRILETNWRYNKDEIDIIAMDGKELVIVEVKTRSTETFGFPEDAVDKNKEKFLIRATEKYIEENNLDVDVRFDIVSIIHNRNNITIRHFEDAFYPE